MLQFTSLAMSVNASSVCAPAIADASWPFNTDVKSWYSCASSAGKVNDLGTTPHMCAGDPASVRIGVSQGKAECLVASAPECKIPMHDFVALDYDFTISKCDGIWAAPQWMTPHQWQWGAGSGEIDSLEFCMPRDSRTRAPPSQRAVGSRFPLALLARFGYCLRRRFQVRATAST
jgi:hypothetical protein